ncbi:MAG TPA: hypothetical protein PK948_06635 [Gemmatimonadales bacterium]|nr:hypothetical protein [Gemmatimonadales bacterium]
MGTASEPTLVALWMQGSALGVIDRIESRLAALEAQRAPQPAPAQEPAPQACDDAAACLMDGCTGPAHAPAAAVTVPDLGTIHGGLDEEGRWVGPALGGIERLKAPVPAAVNFIEWMADQKCQRTMGGKSCRGREGDAPEWCCPPCQAAILRYGPLPRTGEGDNQ